MALAAAEDFGARVQRAQLLEVSPEGKAYQKQLWAGAGNPAATAMQQCFPKGEKSDTVGFTVVGDVNDQGHLQNVAVQPSTPMSRCFVEKFSALRFPQPSASFWPDGMPLVVEMKIKP